MRFQWRADNLSKQTKMLKKQLRVTHKSCNPSRFTDISKSLINLVYFVGKMANKKSDKQEDEQEVSYDCAIFPWTPFD